MSESEQHTVAREQGRAAEKEAEVVLPPAADPEFDGGDNNTSPEADDAGDRSDPDDDARQQ